MVLHTKINYKLSPAVSSVFSQIFTQMDTEGVDFAEEVTVEIELVYHNDSSQNSFFVFCPFTHVFF